MPLKLFITYEDKSTATCYLHYKTEKVEFLLPSQHNPSLFDCNIKFGDIIVDSDETIYLDVYCDNTFDLACKYPKLTRIRLKNHEIEKNFLELQNIIAERQGQTSKHISSKVRHKCFHCRDTRQINFGDLHVPCYFCEKI